MLAFEKFAQALAQKLGIDRQQICHWGGQPDYMVMIQANLSAQIVQDAFNRVISQDGNVEQAEQLSLLSD